MIAYHLLSNIGDRGNNEDNVGMYQRDEAYCFVLADGLEDMERERWPHSWPWSRR